MSQQNEITGGQILLGIGAVLVWRNRESIGEVLAAVLEKQNVIAWNRANNPDAYDNYVIDCMRPDFRSKSSAAVWKTLNLNREEKVRITGKIHTIEMGHDVAAANLEFKECARCGTLYSAFCLCVFTSKKKNRGRASRQSSRAANVGGFDEMTASVKWDIIETKMPAPPALPAHTSTKSVDEQSRSFIAELHRSNPKISESEIKAILKPLIASEFKKPEAEPKKAKKPPKSVTSIQVRERIHNAWCELKSSLGKRKRVTQEEWKCLVRAEFPDADSVLIRKVQSEVHEYNRLKGRAD